MSRGGRFTMTALSGLLLVALTFAASCSGASQNRKLTIGDIGWDENVVVSNLTKALLEDELGYQSVELRTLGLANLFEGVGNGDLDAFQDVWLANHQQYLNAVRYNVELFSPWFQGQTSFGIAVPDYVNITSLDQLNQTDIREILGIERDAVISQRIPNNVIPTYGLKQDYVEASTAGMLAEVEDRYNNGEDFAFVAWSPHWMNRRYDLHLLDDPKDALGDLNDPARMTMIVNENLSNKDPVAYAFMKALTLTEDQLDDLENTINEAGDPLEGARQWARANRDVVQPWVAAAGQAREP